MAAIIKTDCAGEGEPLVDPVAWEWLWQRLTKPLNAQTDVAIVGKPQLALVKAEDENRPNGE